MGLEFRASSRPNTTAIRDDDHYRLDGAKTVISDGATADIVVLVVKDRPCRIQGWQEPAEVGMKAMDTAELFFGDVRVPVANLLGEEGNG
jgi:alkylation response protein AidB-like acyl-CoA dehydrogenase